MKFKLSTVIIQCRSFKTLRFKKCRICQHCNWPILRKYVIHLFFEIHNLGFSVTHQFVLIDEVNGENFMKIVSSLTIILHWLNQTCLKESSGWTFPQFKLLSLVVFYMTFFIRLPLCRMEKNCRAWSNKARSAISICSKSEATCLFNWAKNIWDIEFAASIFHFCCYIMIKILLYTPCTYSISYWGLYWRLNEYRVLVARLFLFPLRLSWF